MKRIFVVFILIVFSSFNTTTSLKGVWEYAGGIYNLRKEAASKDYKLHRQYDAKQYNAFFIEEGEKPALYEKGEYKLKQDTCLETQIYSKQPSKIIGITIKYTYQIKNDTLTFNGMLPNGTTVQEFWRKVK